MAFSMLCTASSSTTCDCHNSITGEVASSWAWQDFGIFAPAADSSPPTRRRHFRPIPDGTCQLKRLHEDNGASTSQPTPDKRVKESHENNSTAYCQLSRSGSSTVSLSEEENNTSIGGQRCVDSSACALRGGDGTDGQSMQGNKQTSNISIDQQIATFLIEEAYHIKLEEGCVYPHPPTNDVLSRIASTPFDYDEMRSCYKQNNGINSDMTTPLPIIPQNKFIEERSHRKLTAIISKDISTFLLSEAAKISLEEQKNESPPSQNNIIAPNAKRHASLPIKSGSDNRKEPPSQNGSLNTINNASFPTQYSTNNNSTSQYDIRLKDVSMTNFGVMHDGSVAFLGYKLEEVEATNRGMMKMKPGDVIVAIDGKNVAGLPGNAILGILQSSTTTAISHLVLVDRKRHQSQHAPKTLSDAKNNYDAAFNFSMSLQRKVCNADAEGRLTKLKQHFQVAEELRGTAWRDLQMKKGEINLELAKAQKAAEAKKAAEATKTNVIPTATASDMIKISHVNVSKLPVAFAFNLDDKASKASAKKAATKWRVEGKKASNSIYIGKNTPCSKVSPESQSYSAKRTAPLLLSTEPLGSKYPNWTKQTFERVSGNTAGTKDAYFFSPRQQIKFRAMKGVDIFIGILAEPDVAGDESVAMKLYTERGYKK
ncbi:hypothetical protein ACHAXM_005370 [Skeletonema potamos]